MIFSSILLLLSIIVFLFTKYRYDSVINPITLFFGVNIISILLSMLYEQYSQYSAELQISIIIMFISFYIGTLLSREKSRKSQNNFDFTNPTPSFLRRLMFVIVVSSVIYDIALIFYLRNLFSNYSITDFFLFMGEVNKYIQSDDVKGGLFNYIVPIGVPLSLLILYYVKHSKKNKLLIFQYILCFLHGISTRRGDLFNMIIITSIFVLLSGIFKIKNKRTIISIALITAVLIVGIMTYTQQLMGKSSVIELNIMGVTVPSFLTDPYIYVALNYPYLEHFDFENLSESSFFMNATFRLFYMFSNMFLGTNVDVSTDFALDFAFFGDFTTNTAPILYYAFKDLGYFFFIDFIILGFVSQKAYNWLRNGDLPNKITASIIYSLLILSFRGYLVIYLSYFLVIVYSIVYKKILKK